VVESTNRLEGAIRKAKAEMKERHMLLKSNNKTGRCMCKGGGGTLFNLGTGCNWDIGPKGDSVDKYPTNTCMNRTLSFSLYVCVCVCVNYFSTNTRVGID